jgi:CheY-like chemotaxis protein
LANLSDVRVLVVEDNVHFRNLVRSILTALGVSDVEEARDGAEALEVLKTFPATLAIVDWKMDGVDGIECVRRIRSSDREAIRVLPLIMVTGYSEPALIQEAQDAGVNDFLAKPISAKSLLSRMTAVLRSTAPFVDTESHVGPDRRRNGDPYDGDDERFDEAEPDRVEHKRPAEA